MTGIRDARASGAAWKRQQEWNAWRFPGPVLKLLVSFMGATTVYCGEDKAIKSHSHLKGL